MKRIDVLREARRLLIKKKECCICSAIQASLESFGYYNIDISEVFPLLSETYSEPFRNKKSRKRIECWWEPGRFDIFCGRRWFMLWLMAKYREDETEINNVSPISIFDLY